MNPSPWNQVPLTVGILIASDRAHAGVYQDGCGPKIKTCLEATDFAVTAYEIVPDDAKTIAGMLKRFADKQKLDLVLTSGGTGLGSRDVTPEATLAVCQKLVPGLADWLRAESMKHAPMAVLSRAVAGLRGRTLIVNLPGNPKAVQECMALLLPILPHALAMITGEGHEK